MFKPSTPKTRHQHFPQWRGSPRANCDHSLSSTSSDASRDRKTSHGGSLSLGQALLIASFWASFSAVLTALFAVHCFSNSLLDMYADPFLGSDSNSSPAMVKSHVLQRKGSHLRRHPFKHLVHDLAQQQTQVEEYQQLQTTNLAAPATLPQPLIPDNGIRPHVAWLMSFPNSGTSFTIHMTREASNCTTATNYALEGEIRDQPSVPAIPGKAGNHGPWLELIPDVHTNIPDTILTKTHCKGFCTGPSCREEQMVHSVRSFMMGCLSGTRAVKTDQGLVKVKLTYKASLVKKAIHIFRHPLDNIVARFHLEYNVKRARGDKEFVKKFPKNESGFRRWCEIDDQNKELLKSRFVDDALREKLGRIFCFNEFFRYVQWHNLAFSVTRDMNLQTKLLHYDEYSTDFEGARDRVLNFLELPRVGDGIEFHSGKIYRSYYSQEQRRNIRAFLEEFASAETWEQLKHYDFESDVSPLTLSTV